MKNSNRENIRPVNDKAEVVVSVNRISKKFCKHLRRSMAYGIVDLSKNLLGIKPDSRKIRKDEFWALNDVNFGLRRGETVGLIGLNGSGKTTLLRLLAGIFPPDKGEIKIKGRVGALIAVGAGFHPYMTGRENIYLNGTILGMNRSQINSSFDEIVGFAEIEEFLDAPVSTYSSGMRVRLGFSIAIAVNPDFLLIDEILAVGDLAFRIKCLNRLNEMKREGVSFILVSHNMTNIVQFTDRAIWLDKGKLRKDGPSLDVSSAYVNSIGSGGDRAYLYGETFVDHADLEEVYVNLESESTHSEIDEIATGQFVIINFCFKPRKKVLAPNVSFPIYNENGLHMSTIASIGRGIILKAKNGVYKGRVKFGPINFNPGQYVMVANFHDGPEHLFRSVVKSFSVKTHENKLTWGLVDFDQNWELAKSK